MASRTQREAEFISLQDFARALGISEPTAKTMVAEGRVAATRTSEGRGNRWLIPASEPDRIRGNAALERLPKWDERVDDLDLVEEVPNFGRLAQSKRPTYDAFVAARQAGKSVEEAVEAALWVYHGRPPMPVALNSDDLDWGE